MGLSKRNSQNFSMYLVLESLGSGVEAGSFRGVRVEGFWELFSFKQGYG